MSVLASDCYKPGDLIHSEEPFVRILKHELWDKACSGCYEIKTKTSLKKCGACGTMQYCGRNCQRAAWPDHKLECPYLRNYKDFRHQEFVQMIGNIILKLKGKEWKSVTNKIQGIEVSFKDLISHADDPSSMTVDPQEIDEPLISYIGKENMPDKRTILELLGKVRHNRFGFKCKKSTEEASESWVLYIGASKLDHSCVPNAAFYNTRRREITIRAIKAIEKGEQVTISYIPMLTGTSSYFIHKNLKASWKNCYCSDCTVEFGQSHLTKILDMDKASDVLRESENILELNSMSFKMYLHPDAMVSRERLKEILGNQEGVLGRTNLLRMQVMTRLYYRHGPSAESIAGLLELVESMKQVWGEYCPELIWIYKKLIHVHMEIENFQETWNYTRKILLLKKVCYGKPFDGSEAAIMKKFIKFTVEEPQKYSQIIQSKRHQNDSCNPS